MKFFQIMNIWNFIKKLKNIFIFISKWIYKIKKKLDKFILYKTR